MKWNRFLSLNWPRPLGDKFFLPFRKSGYVLLAHQLQAKWSLKFAQLVLAQRAERKGDNMKKYAKRLKAYDKIEFDTKEIIAGMRRLKGARRKPTSIALEEELLKELKKLAHKR